MRPEIFCVIFTNIDSHNSIKEIGAVFLDPNKNILMLEEFLGTISDTAIGIVTRSPYCLEVAESMEDVINHLRNYLDWRSDQYQKNLNIFCEKTDLGALTVFRDLIKALPYCKWKNPCDITLVNLSAKEITEKHADNARTILEKIQKDRYSTAFRTITLGDSK